MVFVEWVVFALAAIWTIGTNIALRAHYANSDRPELPANATAMAQLASVIIVAAAGYSPLHLLWLLPISYLTGYFALRSRIVGRVAGFTAMWSPIRSRRTGGLSGTSRS